jgi:K+-transporting ATPase KdpF subunit
MKSKVMTSLMLLMALPVKADTTTASNGPTSYIIGGIIALMILGYLIYTLMRPEKF